MTKEDVSQRFPGGTVRREVSTYKAIQWLARIVGILLCVALIKWAPSDMGNRILCYLLVAGILWWMYGLDEVLVYICERGFVIKPRPTTLRDYMCSRVSHDDYYIYVPFDRVVGFTEDWKELQAVNAQGGIYVVPLDLQMAPYKDKLALYQALQDYKQK